MTGPGDPPEGTPEGTPGGGEDEYRSVVFDESFVRAARLQEYSARERVDDHAPAVRTRHAWARASGSKQAIILILLIALAFGTAIYLGIRHPYQPPNANPAAPLRSTVIPLAPEGRVPGGAPDDLFARSPAAEFRIGSDGINLPSVRRTTHFSDTQVVAALTTAKEYMVRSSLDQATLAGGDARPVRLLLDTSQLDQFDRSLKRPADDGRHAATGWLVRFDPTRAELADRDIRVDGTLAVSEADDDALEVTADYTFVYAVRLPESNAGDAAKAAGSAADKGQASLFTVRREMQFRFDREDLRERRLEVQSSYVQAGPLSCGTALADGLRPLLAGEKAGSEGPKGTNPYAHRSNASLCGVLADAAQPRQGR